MRLASAKAGVSISTVVGRSEGGAVRATLVAAKLREPQNEQTAPHHIKIKHLSNTDKFLAGA